MTEVARALVLPDLGGPAKSTLFSLLLVWDGLEVELTDPGPLSETREEWLAPLEEEGLITVTRRAFDSRHPPGNRAPFEKEWMDFTRKILAPFGTVDLIQETSRQAANEVTDRLLANIEEAAVRAAQLGLAPLAVTPFATLAASLPKEVDEAPVAEGTLIEAAARGVEVGPDTTLNDVLVFRAKNKALMGRFRASLIDLARSIEVDSPAVAAEQAYAVVQNRVEPTLGALNDALDQRRILFTWNMLLGVSAIALSGAATGAAVAGSGSVATQRLRYAFNRERLIREHPYGLLYRAAKDFGSRDGRSAPSVITDPRNAIASQLGAGIEAALKRSLELVQQNPDLLAD